MVYLPRTGIRVDSEESDMMERGMVKCANRWDGKLEPDVKRQMVLSGVCV
jgi:hypothetical protein